MMTTLFILKVKGAELNEFSYLELNDSLLWQAEVHPVRVLHVESAFVKLRYRVVSI